MLSDKWLRTTDLRLVVVKGGEEIMREAYKQQYNKNRKKGLMFNSSVFPMLKIFSIEISFFAFLHSTKTYFCT